MADCRNCKYYDGNDDENRKGWCCYYKAYYYPEEGRSCKYNSNSSESSGTSGGCYIATCVYGSYDCPQVWILRRYRDYKLSTTSFGRFFIKVYYRISPRIVKIFGRRKLFKHLWRCFLDKKIKKLENRGYESSPYEDIRW